MRCIIVPKFDMHVSNGLYFLQCEVVVDFECVADREDVICRIPYHHGDGLVVDDCLGIRESRTKLIINLTSRYALYLELSLRNGCYSTKNIVRAVSFVPTERVLNVLKYLASSTPQL